MFERPRSGERAILVHLGIGSAVHTAHTDELEELARSAGVVCVGTVTGTRRSPEPRLFVGEGKAEEIRERVVADCAEVVIFNHELSPSQERNLERLLRCRVIDRTGLILDIFAQRASSSEGKLQVELAQLRHLSTRLVRGWTHLERQKGGIGLRGPGETQLETDRRLLNQRIKVLRQRLDKVDRRREQGRQTRRKARIATVSLVGYTNAGKSTLFNALTGAEVMAANQLFATLDPTLRQVRLAHGGELVLADTVGFIRDLPPELIAAFRSTLRETRDAALLLHVIDASDEERGEHISEVERTLQAIGAEQVPAIRVYNKIDLCDEAPRVDRDGHGRVRRVWLSARTGEGMQLLDEVLHEFLNQAAVRLELRLGAGAGKLRARLYEAGAVQAERAADDGGCILAVEIPESALLRVCAELDVEPGTIGWTPQRMAAHDDAALQSRAVGT